MKITRKKINANTEVEVNARSYSKAPSLKWIAEQASILRAVCDTSSEEDVNDVLHGYPGLQDVAEEDGRSGVIKKLVDTIEMLAKGCNYGMLSEVASSEDICGDTDTYCNGDGSCDDDDYTWDTYVVKIWYEVDPGRDSLGPVAAEAVFTVRADSPDQAKEYVAMDWNRPIDRIEIIDVNPEEGAYEELPYEIVSSNSVCGSSDDLNLDRWAVGAKVGDQIYDKLKDRVGEVVKEGQSGNYSLIYVDFNDGSNVLKINPMDDAQRNGRFFLIKE